MKRIFTLAMVLMLSIVCRAQDAKPQYDYVDASAFPVYGKATEATSERYTRFPAALEEQVRKDLWNLSRDAAGICIRFRSDSKVIRARWNSTFKCVMNHMTPTGIRGLDLYALDRGEWVFVCTARPQSGQSSDVKIVSGMDGQMREYVLYLSLYDGVQDLELGVEPGAVIEGPKVDWPSREKPVVMYGTSILQGGCANRAGMASSNILSRRLGREVINLGFSGNGKLDLEVAQLMAAVPDPGVYVLDHVPNNTPQAVTEKTEAFFRVLRDAHPDVPVVFIENPDYPSTRFDLEFGKDLKERNAALKAVYDKLRKSGEKRLYYIPADKLIGLDGEATVDGIHFTDLGMVRYAEVVYPVLKKALKTNK